MIDRTGRRGPQPRGALVSTPGVLALAVVLAACGAGPAATPGATGSVAAGTSPGAPDAASAGWRAAEIAQPAAVITGPSVDPGVQCHPCHFLAENELFAIGQGQRGLLAVGVQQPPAQAVAFALSGDGRWAPAPGFAAADGSSALALASDGGRTVAVGQSATGAGAWVSSGGDWVAAPDQADLRVPYNAGAMTSVVAVDGGFVAGGYRDDPLHAAASAAVWRSTDGLAWHEDPAPAAFKGGRILGLAARGGVIVAVGTSGDPNYGPVGAWTWTEASGWRAARVEPDGGGAMRAVAALPGGFVAVGLNGHDDGALAWTSPDGLVWTAVADQDAFRHNGLPLRMQAVVVAGSGLVAGGWRSDAGKGSAVTWTSTDGRAWAGPAWQPDFSGSEIDGLAADGASVVAVGRTGYPDWNQAAIWLHPVP